MNPRTTTGRLFAPRITLPGAPGNMAMINPNLFRGEDPSREGMKWLKDFGIRTVINLRYWGDERKEVESLGMNAISIPLQADIRGSEPPTEDQLRYFFYVLRDKLLGPVYFHCMHGKDRTGTLAAVHRIESCDWSPDEAFEEMQYFGFHDNWVDLSKFVLGYKKRGYCREAVA